MAGLAAALNAPGCIDAIRAALAPRGADDACSRLDGLHGAVLELAVRAAIPAISRVVGDPDSTDARVIAALAIDGVASPTALDASYVKRGPAGLIAGPEPYAVILADAERDSLVLARNGDGPGLYYAWNGQGWLVASEPAALLWAGVPGDPDVDVVRDFVHNGVCDTTARTFLAQVRRVLADEAVVLTGRGEAEVFSTAGPAAVPAVSTALGLALADPRVGLLLGPGPAGAALLSAALSQEDRLRPLPVHTVSFPSVEGPAAYTPAALVPLAFGLVRHTPHTLDPAQFDFDAFLTDVGEPVPDLGLYLLWAVARGLGGNIDTLVDSAVGEPGGMARVRDRIAIRYGVVVRSPLRRSGPHSDYAYESLVDDAELPAVARYAAEDPAGPLSTRDVLSLTPDEVAAALSIPRPWHDRAESIESLRRIVLGESVDADRLFRLYLLERWLRLLPDGRRPAQARPRTDPRPRAESPERADPPVPAKPPRARSDTPEPETTGPGTTRLETAGPEPVEAVEFDPTVASGLSDPDGPPTPADVAVAGRVWTRLPIRTEVFEAGDGAVRLVAWHVADTLTELAHDAATREALRGPWFAVLSGKALAVAQHRACPLWKIEPSERARKLSRLARVRLPRLAEPWTMQVALDDSGPLRMWFAVMVCRIRPAWAYRVLPAAAANLFPPRRGAVSPSNGAVIRAPSRPDEAAGALVEALRYAVPPELVASLAGAAVVSADEAGSRLLGFAPGPCLEKLPDPEAVVALLCLDNPAGQGDQHTPVVLAYPTARWTPGTGPDDSTMDSTGRLVARPKPDRETDLAGTTAASAGRSTSAGTTAASAGRSTSAGTTAASAGRSTSAGPAVPTGLAALFGPDD